MISRVPNSLSSRIAILGVAFALLTGAIGVVTYYFVHEAIELHLDTRIRAEAEALIAGGGGEIGGVVRVVAAREDTHTAGDLGYIVLDKRGLRVGGTLDAPTPPEGYTEFVHYRLANGRRGVAQAYNVAIPSGGRLVVAAEREAVDAMDRVLALIFGGAAVLIVLTGVVSVFLMRRAVSHRLGQIGVAAEAIISGDLSQRMPKLGDTEFDQVSALINRMLERIEHLLGNLRQVSTDLAHDIRSPLNRVRSGLEQLAADEASGSSGDLAAATIREIDDLVDLLNGILGIADIEGFAVRKRFRRLDVEQLAADLFDGYRPVIEANGAIAVFHGQAAWVLGDASLLRRALANLLDNAVVHGVGATRIELRIVANNTRCIIGVSDDGAGIPPEACDAVFRRFVRLEESRTRPGHGLGLNMVAAIALAHHGSAKALAQPVGATIEVSLPLVPADDDSSSHQVVAGAAGLMRTGLHTTQ